MSWQIARVNGPEVSRMAQKQIHNRIQVPKHEKNETTKGNASYSGTRTVPFRKKPPPKNGDRLTHGFAHFCS